MHPYHYKEPNLLLEGIRCGSWSQALKAEHTKTYVSISTTSQMPQMMPYHCKEPNLLLEGIRYNARRISRRWAVLKRTAHCQDNSLAAVDDALSQQITLFPNQTHPYDP